MPGLDMKRLEELADKREVVLIATGRLAKYKVSCFKFSVWQKMTAFGSGLLLIKISCLLKLKIWTNLQSHCCLDHSAWAECQFNLSDIFSEGQFGHECDESGMKQYIKTRWPMCHLVEFDVTHLMPELPAPWSDEGAVGEGPLPDGVTGSLSQKKFRLSFFDFNSFEFVWQRIRSLCLIINSWKSWGNPASDVVARKALLNEVTMKQDIYLSCNYIASMTLYTLRFLRMTELELKQGQTMRPLVVIVTSPFACTIRSGFGIKVCLIQSDSSLTDRLQKKNAISEVSMADTEVVWQSASWRRSSATTFHSIWRWGCGVWRGRLTMSATGA